MESAATFIVENLRDIVQHLITDSVSRHRTFQINIDLKLPHVLIPEYGSIQKYVTHSFLCYNLTKGCTFRIKIYNYK